MGHAAGPQGLAECCDLRARGRDLSARESGFDRQRTEIPLDVDHLRTSESCRRKHVRAGDAILGGVLDDDDLHQFGAALTNADALGRRLREVDDSTLAAPIRSTIVDFDDHLLLRPEIRDIDLRP
jgi:hypothetical protein